MKKYLWMSSAAVVIAALRVNISSQKKMYVVTPQFFCQHMCIQILYLLPFHLHLLDGFNPMYTGGLFHYTVYICWTSPFVISGCWVYFCHFYSIFDGKSCLQIMQTLIRCHIVASDLGLHCLPMTLLQVSS